MENSYRFKVAGHLFDAVFPEGTPAEDYLQPYMPFICDDQGDVLFTLRVEYADDLTGLQPGTVKECLNDEAPYFWMFEKEGRYNFGFSYSKTRPDCLVFATEDFSSCTVYVPRALSEKLTEFGEKQNEVNEALAGNINSLIKRVCALEDKQEKNTEIMKKIATELAAFKRELDRVRLTEKLNSGAIERLSKAISLAENSAEENSGENGEE